LLAAAPALHAQNDSAIAVGVVVSTYLSPSSRATDLTGVGLVGRLRRGSGLGATVGLDWFDSEVKTEIGGQLTPLGKVRVRPLMVGVSYTRQYARYSLATSLVAGYSFNAIHSTDRGRAAYLERLGVADAGFHASNCFAWRQDFSFWYELGNHFGLLASLSYIGARPTVTTTSRLGRQSETINVGAPMLTFGVAYGVF
jgi:hypothetical protein